MKKLLLIIVCLLLLPGAARAAEKNLYDITSETILLAKGFQYCLTNENACAAEDYAEMKASAGVVFGDLLHLLKTGNWQKMTFTQKQARTLASTMASLKAELTMPENPSQACGTALQLIIMAWLSYVSAIVQLISPETTGAVLPAGAPLASLVVYVTQALPAALQTFAAAIIFTLLALVLYPACLL